jgi:hypothetical protein
VTTPLSHWLLGRALFPNYVWKIDGDFIGFEVHAAVTVKSTVFWDVTSRNPVEGYTDVSEEHAASIFTI